MGHQTEQLAAWLRSDGPIGRAVPTTHGAWIELATAACQDGLAGLLLEAAGRFNIEMPAHARTKLRSAAVAVAARNIALRTELERVLRGLNEAGIPVMLLKGAALLDETYGRFDLRAMADLDLLVGIDRVATAQRLLADLGCREGELVVREGFFPAYYYETELVTDGIMPARLDLHVRPFRPLRTARTIPDDALWHGAVKVRRGTSEAWVPRVEFQFIHLAVHAAYHGWARLIWLYDMKRLVDVEGDRIDWALVADTARRWRVSHPLRCTLLRLREFLEPVGPPELVDRLTEHPVSWRDRLVLAHAPSDAASPVAHVFINLLTTPGWRFRAGYLWALMRPDKRHLEEVYPFRHTGWTIVAQAWRWLRAAGRLAVTVAALTWRPAAAIARAVVASPPRRAIVSTTRH